MSDSNLRDEDVVQCLAEYEVLMGESARNRQAIATMFARYEKMGVTKKRIKEIYALSQRDDPEAEILEMLRYAKIVRFISGGMGFVEATEAVDGPEEEDEGPPRTGAQQALANARAYNDGWNSAFKGNSMLSANPCAPGSEEYVNWHRGHIDGAEAKRTRDAVKPDGRKKKPSEQADQISVVVTGVGGGADEEGGPEEEPDLGDPEPTPTERRTQASQRRAALN